MIVLATDQLCKSFGGLKATDDVSLQIKQGELHALIGPNGAGKTTLIAQLSGLLKPDAGRVLLNEKDITAFDCAKRVKRGLTRTFQITSIFTQFSVLENVAFAVQASHGHSFKFWSKVCNATKINTEALGLLETLGLEQRANAQASELSHGEKRQLEIAMALATEPSVLMLDEPMAGMSPEESYKLTQLLHSLKQRTTMLLVEHDMDAVFNLADQLSVLVAGKLIASGDVGTVRQDAAVISAYLGTE